MARLDRGCSVWVIYIRYKLIFLWQNSVLFKMFALSSTLIIVEMLSKNVKMSGFSKTIKKTIDEKSF